MQSEIQRALIAASLTTQPAHFKDLQAIKA
jgi:hypothetical protein